MKDFGENGGYKGYRDKGEIDGPPAGRLEDPVECEGEEEEGEEVEDFIVNGRGNGGEAGVGGEEDQQGESDGKGDSDAHCDPLCGGVIE